MYNAHRHSLSPILETAGQNNQAYFIYTIFTTFL